MKILVTNDDGLDAPGLQVLFDIACNLTSADKIFTVAPAVEQSGMGHAISYKQVVKCETRGDNRWAVFGTPADCILVGLGDVMTDKPDLVLSGVNKGNNAGQNTLYSGTVGATLEAAMHHIPAIALSQFYGPNLHGHDTFDVARAKGTEVIKSILDKDIWYNGTRPIHYNVNFPPCLAKDYQGQSFTEQGFRTGVPFKIERTEDALHLVGTPQHQDTGVGTDLHANMSNKTSITPCTIDLTDHEILARLNAT